jgi:hypothetical protein
LGFVCIAAVLNGPWDEEKKTEYEQDASHFAPFISKDSVIRYERLRTRMMQHAQMPALEGAAILMRRGMLVWLRTCEGDSVLRESVSCFRADSKPLPLELQNAAVSLLSNMILENHQRRRSHDDILGKGYIHTSQA